jgi:hypothetical protein
VQVAAAKAKAEAAGTDQAMATATRAAVARAKAAAVRAAAATGWAAVVREGATVGATVAFFEEEKEEVRARVARGMAEAEVAVGVPGMLRLRQRGR